VVNAYKGWSHQGILLVAEGLIYLSTQSRGIMGLGSESSGRQIQILKFENEVCAAGKFSDGVTEIPFEFTVRPVDSQQLVESYHGVFVSVIYSLQVTCERGMMKKALHKNVEFLVEIPNSRAVDATPAVAPFDISPDNLENVSKAILATIPKFKVTGKLHRSTYPINQPFTGELTIQLSEAPIRSLELQLVRVETVVNDSQTSREATEIQNIQIGDGKRPSVSYVYCIAR
jgi:Vacuolar protein sorting-associated protein 26